MGGLFEAPKPKITIQPVAPAPSPEAEASQARLENRERTTRGLPGTIATSARGLLGSMPDFLTTRRSLLGE
ncbi:MAG: hypothetical protein INF81_00870 [Roseomonas sp.]|jgi:hypothetical protein|nr:hypothetical protein [Roseomonas sp.]MCA3428490.1 hypothetical protein [Roseomonas sp.]MCA3432554.1 hypothetical protein [Roseomonas sp.]MCZ8142301.1 hypothetical protein [Acetobacteraceae bacterium]MCZ8278222.1 hypothetical protein [Acetobacteraceae bacterium]